MSNRPARKRNYAGPAFYYLIGPISFWAAVNISLENHRLTEIETPLFALFMFVPVLLLIARKLTKGRLRVWPDRKAQWCCTLLFLTVIAAIGLLFGFEKAVLKAARSNSPVNLALVLESVLFFIGSAGWVASVVGANIRLISLSMKNPSKPITDLLKPDANS